MLPEGFWEKRSKVDVLRGKEAKMKPGAELEGLLLLEIPSEACLLPLILVFATSSVNSNHPKYGYQKDNHVPLLLISSLVKGLRKFL